MDASFAAVAGFAARCMGAASFARAFVVAVLVAAASVLAAVSGSSAASAAVAAAVEAELGVPRYVYGAKNCTLYAERAIG
jgi:hypothetical protein